jgi:hypothetical protein
MLSMNGKKDNKAIIGSKCMGKNKRAIKGSTCLGEKNKKTITGSIYTVWERGNRAITGLMCMGKKGQQSHHYSHNMKGEEISRPSQAQHEQVISLDRS